MTRCTIQLAGYTDIGLPRLGSRKAICPIGPCWEDHIPGTHIHEADEGHPSDVDRWEWRCKEHASGLFVSEDLGLTDGT